MASQELMLTAHAEGLGSVYIGAFYEDKVRDIMNIPESVLPVGLICLGYPDEKPKAPEREPLERLITMRSGDQHEKCTLFFNS